MSSIFKIQAELDEIFMNIEENDGEVTEEILQELEITQENLREKLDSYRRYNSKLKSDIDICKTEEKRIAAIRKTNENRQKRIVDIMKDAVVRFGNTGKSGNKTYDLIDSKLFTRDTTSVELNEDVLKVIKEEFFDRLRELFDNYMLEESNDSIDLDSFCAILNVNLKAKYPVEYDWIFNKTSGVGITPMDLLYLQTDVKITIPLIELLDKQQYALDNALFINENNSEIEFNPDKKIIKEILKESNLSFCELKKTTSLTIK